MKIALHTVDMFLGRERLMPFRTILEVAKIMSTYGWEVDIINSSVSEHNAKDFKIQNINIIQCPRNFYELSIWVNKREYDVFIFAATIREGLRNLKVFQNMRCRKIAYIPSGITPKCNAFELLWHYGLIAKAWILESITPKRLITYKLKKAGFTDIICLTKYTNQKIGKGIKKHTIYPGKDDFEYIDLDNSLLYEKKLKGEKFYLFTGSPGQVRGSQLLLRAFDKFADSIKNTDIPKIVFLMRDDVGSQYESFFNTLNGLKNKNYVTVIQKKITTQQLKAFMSEAYAVILPFICIPAEIPITYYEVLSCGTPIISFQNGGTTQYLKDGLFIAGKVSVKNLSKAMLNLWNNKYIHRILSNNGVNIISNHPNWEEVGRQWINVILNEHN